MTGPLILALCALLCCLRTVHAESFNFTAARNSSGSVRRRTDASAHVHQATLTYYTIPSGAGASVACGCSAIAAEFPTAAINHYAFGSDAGAGPACGSCFNLTLVEAFLATPPFLCAESTLLC